MNLVRHPPSPPTLISSSNLNNEIFHFLILHKIKLFSGEISEKNIQINTSLSKYNSTFQFTSFTCCELGNKPSPMTKYKRRCPINPRIKL